jgi:hypothetical protein
MRPSEAMARSPVYLDTADNDKLSDDSRVVSTAVITAVIDHALSVCCLRTNQCFYLENTKNLSISVILVATASFIASNCRYVLRQRTVTACLTTFSRCKRCGEANQPSIKVAWPEPLQIATAPALNVLSVLNKFAYKYSQREGTTYTVLRQSRSTLYVQ